MRKILLFIALLVMINCQGQYANHNNMGKKINQPSHMTFKDPELFIPTGILLGGFCINKYKIDNNIGNSRQTAVIAITSMGVATITHLFIKKIRNTHKRKLRLHKCKR